MVHVRVASIVWRAPVVAYGTEPFLNHPKLRAFPCGSSSACSGWSDADLADVLSACRRWTGRRRRTAPLPTPEGQPRTERGPAPIHHGRRGHGIASKLGVTGADAGDVRIQLMQRVAECFRTRIRGQHDEIVRPRNAFVRNFEAAGRGAESSWSSTALPCRCSRHATGRCRGKKSDAGAEPCPVG